MDEACLMVVGALSWLVDFRTIILTIALVAWFLKRFAWDYECSSQIHHEADLLSVHGDRKEAAHDSNDDTSANHVSEDMTSSDGKEPQRRRVIETDAVEVVEPLSQQSRSTGDIHALFHPSSTKDKPSVETQTSLDDDTVRPSSDSLRRKTTAEICKALRRPSCRCKRPAKSASMSEADIKARHRLSKGDAKPVSVTYYYGKLIQVNSGNPVQIGDYNTMELNLSQRGQGVDAGVGTPDEGSDTSDTEFVIDDEEDDEEGSDCSQLCSECRARLTDDEKSLLPPLCDDTPLSSLDSSHEPSIDAHSLFDDQSSCHSNEGSTGDVTNTSPHLLSSDDDLDEPMSPARRLRSITCPASDEEKEQLFVEARIKIYNATEEYRRCKTGSSNNNNQVVQADSKSFKNLLRRKKHSVP